jgi:CDGSH-type Zn-finger protein
MVKKEVEMGEIMKEPVCVRKEPYEAEVEAGKLYYWCSCGLSEKQPFCDGAHSGTGFHSVHFVPETSETVVFCACKKTKSPPFCDGSHGKL